MKLISENQVPVPVRVGIKNDVAENDPGYRIDQYMDLENGQYAVHIIHDTEPCEVLVYDAAGVLVPTYDPTYPEHLIDDVVLEFHADDPDISQMRLMVELIRQMEPVLEPLRRTGLI